VFSKVTVAFVTNMYIMVSTHCHFSQKAAYGRARASSYCIYSFFNVGRYAIPVARDAIPVARDAIPAARYAIRVSREGGNLHLGGIVGRLVDLYS